MQIGFDPRALTVDGQRMLMISGAVHYPRSTPDMWPKIFRASKEAGLNTIETYVFWNLHERRRGVFDFSDRLNLYHFCALAAEHGMKVVLRIGPYICAETNFGGLPPWLRELPGIRMRTWNEPFMREMEHWVRLLCTHLAPLFAPNGGPIILAQMENEYNNIAKYYGPEGQQYLKWCVELGQSLELGIPWVMCVGAAKGAIETINEFYGHKGLAAHFDAHPDQPPLWTEAYPAWYDVWGYAHNIRTLQDLSYAAARFFAGGGTGINYYMWHGGTNFGRETMYLQTTSYDFDAPLDEFGLPTAKSAHLGALHRILQANSGALLGRNPPVPIPLGADQSAFEYGDSLAFVCNDSDAPASVNHRGLMHHLAPLSVQVLSRGEVIFDTAALAAQMPARVMRAIEPALAGFVCLAEPMPHDWPAELKGGRESRAPLEQLALTRDETDYCWYSATIEEGGVGTLVLEGVGDFFQVFVDGKKAAQSALPLSENRTLKNNEGFTQTFSLSLPTGPHGLQILCCALGLIKGDWMLGFENMAEERKGLWGRATWNGREISGWRMQPGMAGERAEFFGACSGFLPWERADAHQAQPLRWWRSTFGRPTSTAPLAVDLSGMGKGLVWVNGRCLGRYWMTVGHTRNPTTPPLPTLLTSNTGEITQRYYHLPSSWLREQNTLVLFEEIGGDPSTIRLCHRT